MKTQMIYRISTNCPAGATVELLPSATKQQMVRGEYLVPVECAFLFSDDVLPTGLDRRSLNKTIERLIAFGYNEAAARDNPKDPYVPFEQLLLGELEVKTIDIMRKGIRPGLVIDDLPVTLEKVMRAFERLRKAGQIAYDVGRRADAA